MIRRHFFNAVTLFPDAAPVEAVQQPGRVPVNPDWLRFIPVKPGRAPVVAGSAPVKQEASRHSPCYRRYCPG
ncbi:hypothetical protein DPMN_054430 [Dreissena polymorpha]|uniref:Uncharacterized protein n=1 Tax=Dreissena polymorpha TaxID=45954 RepID=A0A9D4HT30_DREPO|nr:hypothetical protein DPMN_054430 [Dreissena polymorpha]